MSLTDWTINDIPAAELGVTNITLELCGLQTSSARLQLDARDYTAELPALFAPYAWLDIGTPAGRVFHGLVLGVARAGAPERETLTVSVVDAWYMLENITYEAARVFTAPAAPADTHAPTPTVAFSAHVILGRGTADQPEGIRALLTRALTLAIERYAVPLQIGDLPDGVLLADERANLTVAETIRLALQYLPDALGWIDYATAPPTFHITRRADAPLLTVAAHDGVAVSGNTVNPRYDLLRTGVRIVYEYGEYQVSSEVRETPLPVTPPDGLPPGLDLPPGVLTAVTTNRDYSVQPVIDSAGTGAADHWRNIIFTVPLNPGAPGEPETPAVPASQSVSFSEYHVEYQRVDINSVEWWQLKGALPEGAKEVSLTDIKALPAGRVHREVVSGSFPPGLESLAFDAIVTCKASYQLYNSDGAGKELVNVPLRVSFTGSDSAQEDFVIPSTTHIPGTPAVPGTAGSPPERPPEGLAAQLLAAFSELQYDAELTLTQRAADPRRFHPGQALALTGGRAEWAAARMQVQTVSVDAASGHTRVLVGPTPNLDAASLVDLLRATRNRDTAGFVARDQAANPQQQQTYTIISGGTGGSAKVSPTKTNTNSGTGAETFASKQVMVGGKDNQYQLTHDAIEGKILLENTAESGQQRVEINVKDLMNGPGKGSIAKFRELTYCDGTEEKKILVLATEPYEVV
ncbi:MAG: hypothetical protein LBK76_04460 [Verrucomicrobiales bacterium]|nr:hypothetical protein [Verrucomicrobiales bacterium]